MTPATLATLGKIGVWLLVAGGIGILVEMVVMAVWGVALGRRMRVLTERIVSERADIQAEMARLARAIEETKRLRRPYRRALQWLRHPLVLALLGSYRRRMAAR